MLGGGSGAYCTTQVRLMVDPMLMNNSGLPNIFVIGSEIKRNYGEFKEIIGNKRMHGNNNHSISTLF